MRQPGDCTCMIWALTALLLQTTRETTSHCRRARWENFSFCTFRSRCPPSPPGELHTHYLLRCAPPGDGHRAPPTSARGGTCPSACNDGLRILHADSFDEGQVTAPLTDMSGHLASDGAAARCDGDCCCSDGAVQGSAAMTSPTAYHSIAHGPAGVCRCRRQQRRS